MCMGLYRPFMAQLCRSVRAAGREEEAFPAGFIKYRLERIWADI